MDRKLFDLCSEIYRYFYSKDKDFRDCIEKDEIVRLCSFDNCSKLYFRNQDIFYHVENIKSVELTNIFNYRNDCLEWYLDDIFEFTEVVDDKEERHIRVFEVDSYKYPRKEDILCDRLDSFLWGTKIEIPDKIKVSFKELSYNENINIRHLHMANDYLYYSLYGSEETVSVLDEGMNSNIISIVEWSESLDFPVKEVYWFSKGNFTKARCRKNVDGEYTVVVL